MTGIGLGLGQDWVNGKVGLMMGINALIMRYLQGPRDKGRRLGGWMV